MKKSKLLCFCACALIANGTLTNEIQAYSHNVYIGAGAGTTGINIWAGYYFNNIIGVRVDGGFIPGGVLSKATNALDTYANDYARDNKTLARAGTMKFNSKIKFRSIGLDLSVRPLKGAWRIDLGVRNMDISATANANYTISPDTGANANDYRKYLNFDKKISASVEAIISRGWKPYFGMGWDWRPFENFFISLSIGAVCTIDKWHINTNVDVKEFDKSDFNINSAQLQSNVGNYVNDLNGEISKLEKDLNSEIKSTVNDKIPKALMFWPEVKLTIGAHIDFDKVFN